MSRRAAIFLVLGVVPAMAQMPAPVTRADSLFVRQDWPAVAAEYTTVTSREPGNGMAWFRLGAAFHALGRFDDAIRAYERADSLNFQKISTEYRLSRVYALKREPVKAVEYLDKVVNLGFAQPAQFNAQKDFDPIRGDPRYQALIARVEATRFPCRNTPEPKQFDFWIGEWDVFAWTPNAPNAVAPPGLNRIEAILEHCVLVENWTTPGGDGKSWNYYDRNLGKWRQHWMADGGGSTDYIGEFRDGAMRFMSTPVMVNGRSSQNRMTFTPIHRDTVRQLVETTTDSGRTWATSFDGKYVRRKQRP